MQGDIECSAALAPHVSLRILNLVSSWILHFGANETSIVTYTDLKMSTNRWHISSMRGAIQLAIADTQMDRNKTVEKLKRDKRLHDKEHST